MAGLGDLPQAAYAGALDWLCRQWRDGTLEGVEKPPQDEADLCLCYIEDFLQPSPCNSDVEEAYTQLVTSQVSHHLEQVASHRRWLRLWLDLTHIADIGTDDSLGKMVTTHDLSKYGPEEALGYGVMFGSTGRLQTLEGPRKDLWEKAVASHYRHNPHHPQFCEGDVMPEVHLEESILDMLASRSERTLAAETVVTPACLMDIPSVYLGRYVADDRAKVEVKLARWLSKLTSVIADKDGDGAEVIRKWEDETGKTLVEK